MKKSSFFKSGSGSRKAFVSSFQKEKELKEIHQDNNTSNVKNEIFNKSSESMKELVDNCVSLTVTSPPYNIGKDSDLDLSDEEYWKMINKVFSETYRVTNSGGRLVVNVANLGRKPYIPFSKYFTEVLTEIGFIMSLHCQYGILIPKRQKKLAIQHHSLWSFQRDLSIFIALKTT